MRECSLVVMFEVCALYTAVLLGQIEDVCAWCLHSAHVGYTRTHTVTGSVVVLRLIWILYILYGSIDKGLINSADNKGSL